MNYQTISCRPELHQKIKVQAAKENLQIKDFLEKVVGQYLDMLELNDTLLEKEEDIFSGSDDEE